MNANTTIALIIIVVIVVFVSCVTHYVFRYASSKLGTEKLAKEGVVLTDDGLEVQGLLVLNRKIICYGDVKSVELLSFFTSLLFLFKVSVLWVCTRPFADVVAIEFRSPPQYNKYLLVTPKDAPAFVEQLRRQIKKSQTVSPHI
jgi:hypothetical protein